MTAGALAGRVEAASVAVPTQAHREVAGGLLEAGIDVLVEKPIAATLAEARRADRARRARAGGCCRSATSSGSTRRSCALADVLARPRFIEAHRLAPVQAARHRRRRRARPDDPRHRLIGQLVGAPMRRRSRPSACRCSRRRRHRERAAALRGRLRRERHREPRVELKRERKHAAVPGDAYVSIDFRGGRGDDRAQGVGRDVPGRARHPHRAPELRRQRRAGARDRGVPRGGARRARGRGQRRGRPARARDRAPDHPGARAASADAAAAGLGEPHGKGAPSIQARMSSHTTWRCRSRSKRCQPSG